ncbi:MAG: hypothetical protein HY236_13845 [Acidobacteria bacterium]|nr:hypothetical protein [Acidobacteriota bacterium]
MNTGPKVLSTAVTRPPGHALMAWMTVFQFLDIVTTILGLSVGYQELNPVVFSMIRLDGLRGLLLSKVLALAFAGYFLYSGRVLLLRRVTVLMALLVSWNLFWLVAH